MTSATGERKSSFFGHPWGLATLFGTEMWERFSYYGLRAVLVLFLTAPAIRNGLGLSDTTAVPIVSIYGGLVYLAALPGGWLADRVLGARRTVLWGAVVIMCGHICMAIPVESAATVYLGLFLIIVGSGLLKPNISSMVGYLYKDDEDARRDSGFSLFYMGINLGAFAGILVTPILAGGDRGDRWHLAFGAAAVGMALGLLVYVLGRGSLRGAGEAPPRPLTGPEAARTRKRVLIGVVAAVVVVALWSLTGTLTVDTVPTVLTVLAALIAIAYFTWIMRGHQGITPGERTHMKAYIWLWIAAAIFWMIFEQAAGALTLFAADHADLVVFGWTLPAALTQNFNAIFVIILAPVFSGIWLKYGDRVSTPVKFTIGLVMAGLSFVLMWQLSNSAVDGVKIALALFALVYLIQTIGELCLSPVGLSITTKVAPAALKGQMLGVWFLASAVGIPIGGQAYKFLVPAVGEGGFYLTLGLLALVAGLLLFLFRRTLNRLLDVRETAAPMPGMQ